MKKNLLHVTTIAIIVLLFAACSNEDVFDGIDKSPELTTGRTISLIATMPDGNDNAPGTRVSLTQDAYRTIDLKWMTGDVIELAFSQGEYGPETIELSSYILMEADIFDGGKRARFDLTIPYGIDPEQPFHLCGVYGGGGLKVESKGGEGGPGPMSVRGGGGESQYVVAIMPENPGSATSLNELGSSTSIEGRKDVMLYFIAEDVNAFQPQKITFIHLGSLFSITLKNTSSTTLTNLSEARLVGIGGGGDWVCNVGKGGGAFNLLEKDFYEAAKHGNHISFKAPAETLAPNELMTFWGWYPPNPQAVSPELKLELRANNTYTSFNTKAERTEATTAVAGKSYYFFAEWDGTKLGFSDQDFTPQPGLYEHNVDVDSHLNSLSKTDKESITAMKVTGLLNNDDFEVMKNQMPQLRYLDLLDATCIDNAIPSNAFGSGISTRSSGDEISGEPNKTIVTLTLPSSIKSIGSHAFHGCTGLSGSLIIPNGVTSIGTSAFKDCSELSGDLIIPDGVTAIDEAAFSGCYGFKGSLSIPNSVTTIGAFAFRRCTGFTGDLIIPDGVITIGASAFASCTGFTGDLVIPNSVTSIGKFAFFECNSLEGTLTLSNFLETIEESAFSANYFTGHLTIPSNVTTIGPSAFWCCEGFTGLTLSIGLKSIGEEAFKGCKGFTGNLMLPPGLISIGNGAFTNCTGFDNMLILPFELKSIGEEAFWGCEGFTGNLMLPSGLESIGSRAFGNCTGFTGGLHIPIGLTTIEAEAFTFCSGFDGMLMLPPGLISIGEDAFKYCSGLSGGLFIPDGVTTIGAKAFSHCSSFTGPLTIPNSVTTIGENAFDKCYGFDGALTLPTALTRIERATFFGCSGLTGDLTIPEGVTTIELFAFEGCTSLNGKVILPTSLTSVKHMAFEKCTNVTVFRFLRHTPIPYYVRHWNNLGDGLFFPSNANIEVPSAALATYRAADGWKNHNPSIKGFFSLDGVLPNP